MKEGEDYFADLEHMKAFLKQKHDWVDPHQTTQPRSERSVRKKRQPTMDEYARNSPEKRGRKGPINKKKSGPESDSSNGQVNDEMTARYKSPQRETRSKPESALEEERHLHLRTSPDISTGTSLEMEFSTCDREDDEFKSVHESLSLDEQLIACAKCLDVSSFSYSTMYNGSSESSRCLELKENVMTFLKNSISHRRSNDSSTSDLSPMVYICGRPGTGKVSRRLLQFLLHICVFQLLTGDPHLQTYRLLWSIIVGTLSKTKMLE